MPNFGPPENIGGKDTHSAGGHHAPVIPNLGDKEGLFCGTPIRIRREVSKYDHLAAEKIGWPSLFFDLVFVAAIVRTSHELSDHPDDWGYYVLAYALMFHCWFDAVRMENRLMWPNTLGSMIISCCYFTYMLTCVFMAVAISNFRHFMGWYLVTRIGGFFILPIWWVVPDIRKFVKGVAIINIIQSVFPIICIIINFGHKDDDDGHGHRRLAGGDKVYVETSKIVWEQTLCLGMQLLIHEGLWFFSWRTKMAYMWHIPHLVERMGVFVMLSLGEGVIALIDQGALDLTAKTYGTIAIAFFVIWSQHTIYFTFQPHDPDKHAMRHDIWRGLMWTYCHRVLMISLVVAGTGWKLLLKHNDYPYLSETDGLLMGVSFAVGFTSIGFIWASHIMKPGAPDNADLTKVLKNPLLIVWRWGPFMLLGTAVLIVAVAWHKEVNSMGFAAIMTIVPIYVFVTCVREWNHGIEESGFPWARENGGGAGHGDHGGASHGDHGEGAETQLAKHNSTQTEQTPV